MSERDGADSGPNEGAHNQKNANISVYKPKPNQGRKRGTDRRLSHKTKQFDKNMHIKLAGEEVPKTLRSVSERALPL